MYSLHTLIIHPAISGVISILFLAGIIKISSWCLQKTLSKKPSQTELFCGFTIAIGLICSLTYFLSLYSILSAITYRIPGYIICTIGMIQFREWIQCLLNNFKTCFQSFITSSLLSKVDISLLILIFISMFCIVVGPPTDADSLNYHLGIPLDLLNQGHIPIRHDWLYYNLIGLGEFWNLIGLQLGTDNLGALTQFMALLFICGMIAEVAITQERKLFVIKLIASTPVLLFLATGQKPQLIGTAAILASVLVLLKNDKVSKKILLLSLGSLFFAFSIKYSFFLIGSIVFVFTLYKAIKTKTLLPFFFTSLFFYLAFLFPLQIHKFNTYGDPLSPILTSVLNVKDSFHVKEFYTMLKTYSEGFGFPLGLLVPNSPGFISTILGIGIFAVVFIKDFSGKTGLLILLGIGGFIINFIGGQHTSRFFIEASFLFIAALACTLQLRKYSCFYSIALTLQLLVVVVLSCIGATILFPGAVSWHNRDKVLEKAAIDYSATQILDKQLPQNSFIVSELLANAFLPRPFLAPEYKSMPVVEIVKQIPFTSKKCYLVTKDSVLSDHVLFSYLAINHTIPIPIQDATRNPFNKKESMMYVYLLEKK